MRPNVKKRSKLYADIFDKQLKKGSVIYQRFDIKTHALIVETDKRKVEETKGKIIYGSRIDISKGITPKFKMSIREKRIRIDWYIKNEEKRYVDQLSVETEQPNLKLKEVRKYFHDCIPGHETISTQILETANPTLIKNDIVGFKDEDGNSIEVPDGIYNNCWAKNFPMIADLVRHYRINAGDKEKIDPNFDKNGKLAGYFFYFKNRAEIVGGSYKGSPFDKHKKELKELEEPTFFITKNKNGDRIAEEISGLVKSIYKKEGSQEIRIEVSPYLVWFVRNNNRQIPSNLRELWDRIPNRTIHQSRALMWTFQQIESHVERKEKKLYAEWGLYDVSERRRQEAFYQCLDALMVAEAISYLEEKNNKHVNRDGETVYEFELNKFQILHLDKEPKKVKNRGKKAAKKP